MQQGGAGGHCLSLPACPPCLSRYSVKACRPSTSWRASTPMPEPEKKGAWYHTRLPAVSGGGGGGSPVRRGCRRTKSTTRKLRRSSPAMVYRVANVAANSTAPARHSTGSEGRHWPRLRLTGGVRCMIGHSGASSAGNLGLSQTRLPPLQRRRGGSPRAAGGKCVARVTRRQLHSASLPYLHHKQSH